MPFGVVPVWARVGGVEAAVEAAVASVSLGLVVGEVVDGVHGAVGVLSTGLMCVASSWSPSSPGSPSRPPSGILVSRGYGYMCSGQSYIHNVRERGTNKFYMTVSLACDRCAQERYPGVQSISRPRCLLDTSRAISQTDLESAASLLTWYWHIVTSTMG